MTMTVRKSLTAAADLIGSSLSRHTALGEHLQDLGGSLAASGDETRALHARCMRRHDALGRSLEAAQLAVAGAKDALEAGDGYREPTGNPNKQGGTMTSDGRVDGALPADAPRGFTLTEIYARDQRRGIEHSYNARLRQMEQAGVKR
jgi:hypothetical protein